jgi:nucleoside triphosphate pyrophosphatase
VPAKTIRQTIVLASASPRRRELLRAHGYRVDVHPAGVEEIMPDHFTVGEATLFNAKRKASAIARHRPESVVLGADTLVALEGHTLGKPRNLAEAVEMLTRLSGRTHEVFSGVWLLRAASGQTRGFVEVSRVRFRKLTPAEIERYIEIIDPLDKAGAYAAQEDEMGIIEGIEGSRSNVIGLPMETLAEALRGLF